MWVSGGNAPFLAPSGALSICDGEGWGEAAPPAPLLVRTKNLPVSPVMERGCQHRPSLLKLP